MRITLPSNHVTVILHNRTMNVKLVERKLNQHLMYVVAFEGIALHIGRNKDTMRAAFNRYRCNTDLVTGAEA